MGLRPTRRRAWRTLSGGCGMRPTRYVARWTRPTSRPMCSRCCFWKWTSDTWDWEHATAVEEFGEDVPAEVEADYHRFSLPVGTHWRQVTTRTANLVCEIGKALGRIEQANPISLAGIFGDAAWGNKERLPAPSLVALVNAFNGLVLNPDQV
jgi:type I restriction enzyme M protein